MRIRKRKSNVAIGSNYASETYLIKRPKKEHTSIKIGTIILHQRNIFKLINLLKIKEQKPLLLSNPTYRVKLGPANWKKGVKIIGNQGKPLIHINVLSGLIANADLNRSELDQTSIRRWNIWRLSAQ
jgi:hypothetical protein